MPCSGLTTKACAYRSLVCISLNHTFYKYREFRQHIPPETCPNGTGTRGINERGRGPIAHADASEVQLHSQDYLSVCG